MPKWNLQLRKSVYLINVKSIKVWILLEKEKAFAQQKAMVQ